MKGPSVTLSAAGDNVMGFASVFVLARLALRAVARADHLV